MDIQWVPIEEVHPDPDNRNKHSKEQITRLVKLIRYQGWRWPIIVSKQDGLIKAGHARLLAAQEMGLQTVPVSYQDFVSEEQAKAFEISDNEIARWAEPDLAGINSDVGMLGPDFDIDLLGMKDFAIEVADKIEPQCHEDHVPESKETICKLGDIWQLGRHRLMCGDSTSIDAVEKLMNGEKAELCFTSPPYSDQREYNGGKDLSTEHLATFIRAAYGKANYFAVNLGYSRKNGEVNPYWDDYIKESKDCGIRLLSWNIWDRSGFGYTVGQATAMFTIDHEFIFIFGDSIKDLNRTIENKQANISKKSTIREKSGDTRSVHGTVGTHRQLGTVFRSDIARYVGDAHHKHPAMFPVVLPEAYIEAMTAVGESVYEPFGGSGSTLIACEKTNRKCFMMELDPHYCDVIVARWEKYTGKKAELISGETP